MDACFWDTSDPYYYLRADHNDDEASIIFGGKDVVVGEGDQSVTAYRELAELLLSYIPSARVTNHWSGQIVASIGGLPYTGPLNENQFVVTGFCGNGLTFGTIAATMAYDWLNNRSNRWSALFDVHRNSDRQPYLDRDSPQLREGSEHSR